MSEFTGINGGDYGDLQAVVRGCNNGFFSTTTTFMDDPPATCFASANIQQDDDDEFLFSAAFPDELEQLYKPFYYPMLKPLSPQSFLSSSSSSISVSGSEEREPEKVQEKEAFSGSAVVSADASTSLAVKYKRRKTQHKRVVLQVTAEDLSSDTWAWRKYGQKPIKGSPHPRSYYRCSNSKGCLARKQVEWSQSDPNMFVVSYTAEHCHHQPTRRSSLAGTTRHKFSVPKSSTSTGGSPISSSAASPQQNLSLAAMEDEQTMKKNSTEEEENEQRMISERSEHNDNGELMICDMILSDDFL